MRFNKAAPVGRRITEDFDRTFDEYDDDISIDFIDDSPKPTFKQTTDDKLKIIDDRLTRIEGYLKQLLGDKATISTQPSLDNKFGETAFFSKTPATPIQESQPSALYAPKNVRPQGSMLEEIQQVLTTQDAMQDPTNMNAVDLNCSSDIVYNDDFS